MKKVFNKKGFTLIELIVVIAILAILAAILIPSLTNYLARAKYAKEQSNARSIYTAVVLLEATAPTPATATAKAAAEDSACTYDVAAGVVTTFSCTWPTSGGGTGKVFASPLFNPAP